MRHLSTRAEGHSARRGADGRRRDDESRLTFPRRDFLKAGGALVVGFTLARRWRSRSSEPPSPGASRVPVRPIRTQLDTWIAIHADNTATIYIGYAELGQGACTALLQIAAEELDLDMSQVSDGAARDARDAESGRHRTRARRSVEAGRRSARRPPRRGRRCCARLDAGSGVPVDRLTVSKASSPSPATRDVRQLRRADRRQADSTCPLPARRPSRPSALHDRRARRSPRIDIPDKVSGKTRLHAARARAGHAARSRRTAARSGRVRRRRTHRQPRRDVDPRHSRRPRRSARRLSSASSRRTSGTRCAPHSS